MSRDRLELPPLDIPPEPPALVRERARLRIRLAGALLCAFLAAIGARGAWLSVHPIEEVVQAGSMQRWGQVVLRAQRGEILDQQGRRLATSVATPSVAVDPALIDPEERDELAVQVAAILELPVDEVASRMARQSRYARLAARVHPAVAAEIDALRHPGVWTHRDPHRYYPEASLGASVLGFVDASGMGQAGLEATLDRYLRGGSVVVQRRRDRRGLAVDEPQATAQPTNRGSDVHLTIDRHIQRIAERALEGVIERSDPEAAYAVVVDVKTGDILAMANAPGFNPNAITADAAPRRNHVVQDAIEPGSTYKPFPVAAALEEGLVTPETVIDCQNGFMAIGRARIRDYHPRGLLSLTEVVKYSSNIGTAKLAFDLGNDRFISYLRRFGFSERTGIPLPGERRGRLRSPHTIKPIEVATTSFGQGTTVTALQLAMGTAALGNGGVRMEPRLVTRVVDAHGVPELIERPTVAERVVSEQTARQVVDMMVTVTEPGGTGTRAAIPGYRVAGKTGTAQKVRDGRYGDGRIGSFVGLVPADDPAVAIVVIVDEPRRGSRFGGIVAGPAFAEIGAQTLRHLGIAPDPELLGQSEVVAEAPAEPAEDSPLAVQWTGAAWALPDLRGRSMREVLVGLQDAGLRLELEGSGLAVAQRPDPGEPVPPGGAVTVVFQ